ncbi:MAG TPA: aminoglycoside phosphotransferase family protein [Ilumatobacteraceae bacterium]|nr:aminoglycoside phosphotransferase family protein [Ilumatobacteraceae bacterium]
MVGSISKTLVGHEQAAAIVVDAFGADVHLVELTEATEGWFNAAYVMTLSDGRRCVLKVAPPPGIAVLTYEHDIMATEVAALALVAERTTMPVPHVLWSDTTCRRLPSALFVMEHCPGTLLSLIRPTLDVGQQQFIDGQLAGFLREMHSITNPMFGLQAPSAPKFETWRDAFLRLFEDALADGATAGTDFPVSYETLRSIVENKADFLDDVAVPRFVHWDLWDSNVFVDPDTLEVVGVIDFERSLWGDPLMEAQFVAKADDEAFIASYGTPMLDTQAARIRRLLYDLYLFVIMVVEVSYRHYPTDDIDRFSRERLATTLDKLASH